MSTITKHEMEIRLTELSKLYDRKARLECFLLSDRLDSFQLYSYTAKNERSYLLSEDTANLLTSGFLSLEVLKTNARNIIREISVRIQELETV